MGKLLSLPGPRLPHLWRTGLTTGLSVFLPGLFQNMVPGITKKNFLLKKKKFKYKKKIQNLILKISRKVTPSRHCQISLGPRAEDEAKITLSSSGPWAGLSPWPLDQMSRMYSYGCWSQCSCQLGGHPAKRKVLLWGLSPDPSLAWSQCYPLVDFQIPEATNPFFEFELGVLSPVPESFQPRQNWTLRCSFCSQSGWAI